MLTHWSYVFLALTHRHVVSCLNAFPGPLPQIVVPEARSYYQIWVVLECIVFFDKYTYNKNTKNQKLVWGFTDIVYNMTYCAYSLMQVSWWLLIFVLPLSRRIHIVENISQYNDVIISAMASQITSLSIVYSTVCGGADQRKQRKVPRHWPLYGEFTGEFISIIHQWYVAIHNRWVFNKFICWWLWFMHQVIIFLK